MATDSPQGSYSYNPKWTPEPPPPVTPFRQSRQSTPLARRDGFPRRQSPAPARQLGRQAANRVIQLPSLRSSRDTVSEEKEPPGAEIPLMEYRDTMRIPPVIVTTPSGQHSEDTSFYEDSTGGPTSERSTYPPSRASTARSSKRSFKGSQILETVTKIPGIILNNIYQPTARMQPKDMRFSEMDPEYHMGSLQALDGPSMFNFNETQSTCHSDTAPNVNVVLADMPKTLHLAEDQPQTIAQLQSKEREHPCDTTLRAVISFICHATCITVGLILWWRVYFVYIKPWADAQHAEPAMQIELEDELEAAKQPIYKDVIVVTASVVLGAAYLIVLIESMSSACSRHLRAFVPFEDAIKHFEQQRRCCPRITMTLRYDHANLGNVGNIMDGQTAYTRTYQEKMSVRNEKFIYEIPIKRCVDVSGTVWGFCPGDTTRVEATTTFGFINEKSRKRYEKIVNTFLGGDPDKRRRDEHPKMEIAQFKDLFTVYFVADGRHRLMRHGLFWWCSMILFSWPYRWWFKSVAKRVRFTLVKLIEIDEEVDEFFGVS